MINASVCKANLLMNIEKYCTEQIEPLMLKSNGTIYFGKYTRNGEYKIYIHKTYAKDCPRAEISGKVEYNPFDIKKFLEMNGYKVEWVEMEESYPAGYSASKRTCYYKSGFNKYYSLKISC